MIPISVSHTLMLLEDTLYKIPLQDPSTLNSLVFLSGLIHLIVAIKGRSTIFDIDNTNWAIAVFLASIVTCNDFAIDTGTVVVEVSFIWL